MINRTCAAFVSMLLLWPCAVFAQQQEQKQQQEEKKFSIEEGPWLQNVRADEFTVVWKSSADAVAWVETATDDGLHFNGAERPKYFATHLGQKKVGQIHSVRVTGLEPGTEYRYRIFQQQISYSESGGKALPGEIAASVVYLREPFRVRTADPEKSDISFVVVNDIHNRDSLFRLHTKGVKAGGYDFVVFNGDMTSYLRDEKELFDGYLRSASELFATDVPFYMARGNHEARGAFAGNFMDYFPSSTGMPYYTFRQGPVFFVVLDGGEDKPDSNIEYSGLAAYDQYRDQQAEWLAGVVESREFREAPVRMVIVHMPPVRSGWYGPIRLAAMLRPLLKGKNIALMMSGHTHRESYDPPSEDGFDFPILINSNNNRLEVKVEGTRVEVNIVRPDGTVARQIKP